MEKHQRSSSVVMSPVVDRISDLPYSIICYLLSFLPTKDAVATSILGSRWKFLWTKVPALDFDDDEDDFLGNNGEEGERMSFVQIVNKVILHRDDGHLEKFFLRWRDGCEAAYVNEWVSYAIAKNIRVLSLELDDKIYVHPGTLFTCGTLEILRLCGFFVKVPSVVCLPKLEVLVLDSIDYESDESIHNLISGCPALHSLRFIRNEFGSVKISSPSLRDLHVSYSDYEGCPSIGGTLEIDAPALESLFLDDQISQEFIVTRPTEVEEVKLDLDIDPDSDFYLGDEVHVDGCNSVAKLIQALDRVKLLVLNGTIMKSLSYATTPLTASFDRLTKLDVELECCNWSSLSVVLGCCIKLEVLNIQMYDSDGDSTHEECWRDPKMVPTCLLSSLVEVSYSFFNGLEGDQPALLRYILMQGAVMKRLKVHSYVDHDLETKSQVSEKILMFPRSSPTCKILFDW